MRASWWTAQAWRWGCLFRPDPAWTVVAEREAPRAEADIEAAYEGDPAAASVNAAGSTRFRFTR